MQKQAQKKRILVVDDNEFFLQQQISCLEGNHFEVQTARSGSEALENARSFLPNLILLDKFMPDLDGPEVCRILKNDPATATIPIIIVSSGEKGSSRKAMIKAGGDGILFKPIRRDLLVTMVEEFLGVPVRKWRRAKVVLPCWILLEGVEGVESKGTIHSLSGGGAFIESIFPFVPGDLIMLQFTLPKHDDATLAWEAVVIWTGKLGETGIDGAGVRLLTIDPVDQADIDDYISTLIESKF